jgi:hypothetical protein
MKPRSYACGCGGFGSFNSVLTGFLLLTVCLVKGRG